MIKELENQDRSFLGVHYKYKMEIYTTNFSESFEVCGFFWMDEKIDGLQENFDRHRNEIKRKLQFRTGDRYCHNTIALYKEYDEKFFNMKFVSHISINDFEEITSDEKESGKYYKLDL